MFYILSSESLDGVTAPADIVLDALKVGPVAGKGLLDLGLIGNKC